MLGWRPIRPYIASSVIHRHHARIADRKLEGITTQSPEQLELFSTLNLPKPA
jgi:hypothetical protein